MFQRRWLALLLPWLPLFILALALAFGARHAHASDAVVQNPCGEAEFDLALGAVLDSGGGTLTFNCVPTTTISLSSAKTINGPVTIDGGGTMHLSGGSFTRLFNVDTGARLTLKRIVIQDGFGFADGGAILNDGDLILDQATFQNNRTNPAFSGGAIVTYGPLTITNSLFDDNQSGGGGAIYVLYAAARTTIQNTVFQHNGAINGSGRGGALLTWDGALVNITGGEFFSNTARNGGAIYNDNISVPSSISLTNVSIRENRAINLKGGGLYNTGLVTITGGSLSSNVVSPTSALLPSGGGLYNDLDGTAVLNNVAVRANHSTADGGGIANYGLLLMTGGELSGNVVGGVGGGAYITGSTELTGMLIFDNQAFRGGGLFVDQAYLNVNNSTLSANAAVNNGGGIYNRGNLQLSGGALRNNHAGASGGALFQDYAGNIVFGTIYLSSATVEANSALDGGGAYSNGALLSIYDSAFNRNMADRGAGISANGTTLLIHRSALWGNQAQTYGGALALNFADTNLVNTTLSGNSAGAGGGGAIQTFSTGPTKLLNVTISHNSAAALGGGLHILPGAQPISLTNTLIGNSLSGGNCYGSPSGANYSLSDDVTCTLTGAGNQTHVPLQLSALGNYGGPTPVHMPKSTSPAIDSVGGSDVPPAQDQRGLGRPKGAGYDIGAVERQPDDTDLAPRIFLPLTRR